MQVKLSPSFLACASKALIDSAPPFSPFSSSVSIRQIPIKDKISIRWIQTFMEVQNLVCRRQAGNKAASPEKQLFIDETVACHLGCMKRSFASGEINEDMVENTDATHFIFNMDNGRTIGFRGQEDIKCADVVSDDEGIIMIVRVTGGAHDGIAAPCWCFKTKIARTPSVEFQTTSQECPIARVKRVEWTVAFFKSGCQRAVKSSETLLEWKGCCL